MNEKLPQEHPERSENNYQNGGLINVPDSNSYGQYGKGSSGDDNCENILKRITDQCDSVIKKAQNPGTEVKIKTLFIDTASITLK